ncbi:hypothetical protein G7047_20225 [Diaphorobacter sp. HDW4A]|uniref:hypothetical protein n=1 Tax=Diaphorobacter sp. HDW4A TaxID=2714924 RepID=UPI00140B992D|nr:hypothetical protein [Diaphorobacter sp. HDW4A]QIL81994.1 hypothetical protein G7047_20225 [Diaphorobacter sp. HDW4A]
MEPIFQVCNSLKQGISEIAGFDPEGVEVHWIRCYPARQVEKSTRLAKGTDRMADRFFMRAPVDFRVASALTRPINAVSFGGASICSHGPAFAPVPSAAVLSSILYYPRKSAHLNIKIVFFTRFAQVSEHRSNP